MKQIDVSTPSYPNMFTLVDDEDYGELNKHKWTVDCVENKLYLSRQKKINGQWKKVRMHREILGLTSSEIFGDHRNGDTMDNTRGNLRGCSDRENRLNTRIRATNTSGYKGVTWSKKRKKWVAQIGNNGKCLNLGGFTCIIKAAKAYDKAALSLFGEFANINLKKGI